MKHYLVYWANLKVKKKMKCCEYDSKVVMEINTYLYITVF
jgi:hypothetical protein